MSALVEITTRLAEVFAPLDAEILEDTKTWAAERVAAVSAWRDTDAAKLMRRTDLWGFYAKLHEIAGGKTWHQLFSGRSASDIEALVVKHCANVVAKRNASIAAKLTKAGVTEVLDVLFTHSDDGFNGTFAINTTQGYKTVYIDTVLAGGYNIQCLHMRALIRIK